MEVEFLKILLIILCLISIIPVALFFVRRKEKDTGVDYEQIEKIIAIANEQMQLDLKTLDLKNKEIDEIEQKILICKKKLNMKLFRK